MADWQITAATFYCDDIGDEVTVIVRRDGSARCVWFARCGEAGKDGAALVKGKRRRRGGPPPCPGPECHLVARYRERVFAQEADGAGPAGSAKGKGSD